MLRALLLFVGMLLVSFFLLQAKFARESREYKQLKLNEHEHNNEPQDPRHMNDTEYAAWCHDVSDVNIYTIGSKLNCKDNSEAFSMSFVVAIIFTIAIEIAAHFLESRIKTRLHLVLLNKIYKGMVNYFLCDNLELMMVGLIGLLINMAESVGAFHIIFVASDTMLGWVGFHPHKYPETEHQATMRRILIFDLVHVSLFFLSVFHVTIVAIAYSLVHITIRFWRKYEEQGEEATIQEYLALRQTVQNQYKIVLIFRWILLFQYTTSILKINYFMVRTRFIAVNRITKEDFHFHRYLRQCILTLFSDLIDIGWKLWIIVWLAFFINYVRNKLVDFRNDYGGIPVFVALFGGGTIFLAASVYLCVRAGYAFYVRHNHIHIQDEHTGLLQQVTDENMPQVGAIEMKRYFFLRWPNLTFGALQIYLLLQSVCSTSKSNVCSFISP